MKATRPLLVMLLALFGLAGAAATPTTTAALSILGETAINSTTIATSITPSSVLSYSTTDLTSLDTDSAASGTLEDAGSFTTTTKVLTVTSLATITCTIGHVCPEIDSTNKEVTTTESASSTTTRTVIVLLNNATAGQYLAKITPLTPRPLSSYMGQSVNASKAIISNTSFANSTSVTSWMAAQSSTNSTLKYSSLSLSAPLTSVTTTTLPASQPPTIGPSTITTTTTPIIIPVTSTIIESGGPASAAHTSLILPGAASELGGNEGLLLALGVVAALL